MVEPIGASPPPSGIYHQPVKADADPERAKAATRVTWLAALVNLLLSIGKGYAGVVGNSSAMVADAVHSLSDLATDAVVFISVRIAAQGADDKHPYGHGRAETIGTAIIGAALIVAGGGIAYGVIDNLIHGKVYVPTWPAIVAAIVSIVANEGLYHYTAMVGRVSDNKTLIANAWHHRSDSLSSVAAMIGVAGAMAGWPILDPLAAIVVVYMIVKVGWDIAYEALNELMEATAPPEKLAEIKKVIVATSGVRRFHEMRTRTVGADLFIDVHILVAPNISVSEAHNIAETVRDNLKRETGATDALVHIDAEDDIHYRILRFDRGRIEREVVDEAARIDGVFAVSEFIIHTLKGRICVDFTLEMGDEVTFGEAKKRVETLRRRLLEHKQIDTAVIRGRLTPSMLESGFAPSAPSDETA
jgi:cation diffusion facilitator family transporter